MSDREGTYGISGAERWFCTWKLLKKLQEKMKCALIDLKPFSRWKGLLMAIHMEFAKELQEGEKPHMDSICLALLKDRQIWHGTPTQDEHKGGGKGGGKGDKGGKGTQYKANEHGRKRQNDGQHKGRALFQNKERPCVPHFNPNDVCKHGNQCRFSHSGTPPDAVQVAAYYKSQGAAPPVASYVAPPPFMQMMGPPGMPPLLMPPGAPPRKNA